MSYLHCHNCGWSQDDFWSENYSPFRGSHFDSLINSFHEIALNGDLDELIKHQYDVIGLGLPETTTYREFFALEIDKKAHAIRNQVAPTDDDWQKIKKKFRCPGCGSPKWDID